MRKVWIVRLFITLLAAVSMVAGLVLSSASAAPPIVVSLTFNGNTASQYSLALPAGAAAAGAARDVLHELGHRRHRPGLHDVATARRPAGRGNEIGGLTTHFTDLTAAPAQTATRRDVRRPAGADAARAERLELRLPLRGVQPGGRGHRARRADTGSRAPAGASAPAGPELRRPDPPTDYLAVARLRTPGQITLAACRSLVNGAAAQGGWIPVVIQNVCSQSAGPGELRRLSRAPAATSSSPTSTAFLDWLAASGQAGGAPADTVVQTMRQLATSVDTDRPLDDDHM